MVAGCSSGAQPSSLVAHRSTTATPFWDVLHPGLTWELHEPTEDIQDEPLSCIVRPRRTIERAQVIPIECTYRGGRVRTVPDAIVLRAGNVWLVRGELDAATLASALQAPPHGVDPPATSGHKLERFMRVEDAHGDRVVCIGQGPGHGAGECENTCFEELCIAARGGIVRVEGNWAPMQGMFHAAGFGY